MAQVELFVPSSSANVGLGYDVWCLGLDNPKLMVTYAPSTEKGVRYKVETSCRPTKGRVLGTSGKKALEKFLEANRINDGADIYFKDSNYPVGGLGRSGAEAVGAVLGAAIFYGIKLSRNDAIIAAAEGEPGNHKDNVAASVNGRFNIIIPQEPATGKASVDFYNVPKDLGLAMGFSSYQKTGGTEAGRQVLRNPVDKDDFVAQTGLISGATAAFVSGNTDRFIDLAWGDRFHQPRRAAVGFYGNFNNDDFLDLQKRLYNEFHIAWNVSGAGPNMQATYNTNQHPDGIVNAISPVVVPWFAERGIGMRLEETQIAEEGAYDLAQKYYDY